MLLVQRGGTQLVGKNIASTAKKLYVSAPLPLLTHAAGFWGLDSPILFEPWFASPTPAIAREQKISIAPLCFDNSCCGDKMGQTLQL